MYPMAMVRGIAPLLFTLTVTACVRKTEEPQGMPYPVPAVSAEGEPLAVIGPITITTKEAEARMNKQSPFLRARFRNIEKRREFVEQEIHFEVLAQEAWRRKLYNDEKMVKELKKLMVGRLLESELDKRIGGHEVTDQELRAAYLEARDEFNKPERVRLSQIVRYVENDAQRKEARQVLEEAKKKILESESRNNPRAFAAMANQKSEDQETRTLGGDLSFMTKEELSKRFGAPIAETMFKAKIGDLVIVDAENAVVLFRKTGNRRAVERTLEMVKPQLLSRVRRERRNRELTGFIDEIIEKNGIIVNGKLIPDLEIDFAGKSDSPEGKAQDPKKPTILPSKPVPAPLGKPNAPAKPAPKDQK